MAGAAECRRAAAVAGCACQSRARRSQNLEGAAALPPEEKAAALMVDVAGCQAEGSPADNAAV